MHEGNPGEINFGSGQGEVQVSKCSIYWESTVLGGDGVEKILGWLGL